MGTITGRAKGLARDIAYGNTITLAIRLILGAMFLYSGAVKAMDPEVFGSVVARYNLLPDVLVPYPAMVIPYLELLVGLCLAAGYRIRSASLVSASMMLVFAFAIAVNVARGEAFRCGCFELDRLGIGISETVGAHLVVRDVLLMGLFILLMNVKKHVFSVDYYLERRGLKSLR
ncbi:MAG: DoxX family membrane protein [Spirochaetes bacterium]|nr:DoxX family membrane protein [Spirochaetota bacterium]